MLGTLRWVLPVAAVAVLLLLAPTGGPGYDRVAAGSDRVVVGSDGFLFIAQDWTVACQDRGRAEQTGRAVDALVSALEAGGREAVVVVGPDKSTVERRRVPARGVPEQVCGSAARAAAWSRLQSGPAFLDLRPALARAARGDRPPFWRKDTHWTPTGGAVFARELAGRLDPALADRLRTRTGRASRAGDLARDLGRPDGETVAAEQVVNPGVTLVDHGYRLVAEGTAARWVTTRTAPGARVLPGRTLFVGDSYTGTALASLAALSQDTVALHPGFGQADLAAVLRQIALADRVVVQVVERFDQRYRMFQEDAAAAVRGVPARRLSGALPPPGPPCRCGEAGPLEGAVDAGRAAA